MCNVINAFYLEFSSVFIIAVIRWSRAADFCYTRRLLEQNFRS